MKTYRQFIKETLEHLVAEAASSADSLAKEFSQHINNVHPEHKGDLETDFRTAYKRRALDDMKDTVRAAKKYAGANISGPESLSSETKRHLHAAYQAHKNDPEEFGKAYRHLSKASSSHYRSQSAPGKHEGFDSLPSKTQHSMVHALRNHKSNDPVQAQNADTATSVPHLDKAVGHDPYKGIARK